MPFQKTMLIGLLVLWMALAFSIAVTEISFVFVLVFWLAGKIKRKSILSLPPHGKEWIPLTGYVLICVFSYFWSDYSEPSFRGVFKVIQQVVLFCMVADLFRQKGAIRKFEIVFLVFFIILSFDGFIQYITGSDFIRGIQGEDSSAGLRISASFKSYGIFGAYLIATIPYLFFMAGYLKKRKKSFVIWGFAYLGVLAGLLLLFWTRSRGAMLAFVLGVFVFLLLRKKWKICGILVCLAVAGLFILPHSMIIHLDAEGKEQSIVERYYLWERAVDVIRAKPLTGTGINTYAMAHGKYDQTRSWRVIGYYAHNGYLQLAAETGLPSLVLLLWFFILYFWSSLKALKGKGTSLGEDSPLRLGLLVGLANFLILVFIDTVFHNPQPVMIFWYLMGIQWAYLHPRETSALDSN